MRQNEMVGLARTQEMCVSLLRLTLELRLTLDCGCPDSDHLDSEDEIQIGIKRNA